VSRGGLLCGQESISGLHGQALVDHPGCDERMVVVLKTESEAMKFFFQGCDELKMLLNEQPLVPKHDILRFGATSQLFTLCTSVTDLVVIGHGALPTRTTMRPTRLEASSPHHIIQFRRAILYRLGHPHAGACQRCRSRLSARFAKNHPPPRHES
jgi:hypothetical protein